MNNQRPRLEERTIDFSKDVIGFCISEKSTIITRPIIDQLIRSATSIGANYAEAVNAASKSDFRNKVFIAKKEAAEAKYWLIPMLDITSDKTACAKLAEECHYILMTLQKIISVLNTGKRTTATA